MRRVAQERSRIVTGRFLAVDKEHRHHHHAADDEELSPHGSCCLTKLRLRPLPEDRLAEVGSSLPLQDRFVQEADLRALHEG